MATLTKAKSKLRGTRKQVKFMIEAPEGWQVAVTGEFTGWSPEGVPLSRGPSGEWRTTLELDPGEYQYRLRIDGEWKDHPTAEKRVPNAFGSVNCVLAVPQG
jgi:1,4-alpha-glucan branching enzyme